MEKSMKIPNREEFDEFVLQKYTWRALDKAIYSLCRMRSARGISVYDAVWSAVDAVGLTYRAAIGHGSAIDRIAKRLAEWASVEWDHWTLEQLKALPLGPSLSIRGVRSSIRVHGEVCSWLKRDKTIGFCPRSLVSKWLHFARPGVPIYDSRANAALASMDFDSPEIKLAGQEHADQEYARFCSQLIAFSKHLGYPPPSVRELDVYLYLQGAPDGKVKLRRHLTGGTPQSRDLEFIA